MKRNADGGDVYKGRVSRVLPGMQAASSIRLNRHSFSLRIMPHTSASPVKQKQFTVRDISELVRQAGLMVRVTETAGPTGTHLTTNIPAFRYRL